MIVLRILLFPSKEQIMFKKTKVPQLNLFSSPSVLFSGKSRKMYDDKNAWHNRFYQEVTCRIDENLFKPLYCSNNGMPNAPIRVLISMMILKEAEGLSDLKLFENCRYNLLTRCAIGLVNADDPVPADSTYYLFRKRILDYANAGNDNLLDLAFAQVTKNQCLAFEVSGKRIRMDSKLLGSNIAWLSRYELIHETFRLFYDQVKQEGIIDPQTTEILNGLLELEGTKVVYTSSSEEVKTRLQKFGELIYRVLPLFSGNELPSFQILTRVFNEQFKVGPDKIVVSRNNEEITANSVQSPHDTDCTYRKKEGNQVKGYSINITESCDDGAVLNLIGNVDVRTVSTSDVDFFQDAANKVGEVFPCKTEAVHTDGAYHSPANQEYCKDENIELYLHAIQGAKGRYQLDVLDNDTLSVLDTSTNELIDTKKVTSKEGMIKWRVKAENGYRYFTQENIDTYQLRKKIAETPIEILQKRNNVEATVFQLAYHYPNAKSRYRGLIKHQMWADIRCLWVNFVRIMNFNAKKGLKTSFFAINLFVSHFIACLFLFRPLMSGIYQDICPKFRYRRLSGGVKN